jgi:Tfp pilus assembly protein PilN
VIEINLLPAGAPSRRNPRPRLSVLTALAGLGLLGSITALSWAALGDEAQLAASVEREALQLADLQAAVERERRAHQRAADLGRQTSVIEELVRHQGTPLRVLEALGGAVPPDLRLTTLEGRGLELRARGAAHSAMAVADLMSGLHASGVFRDIEVVVSRQDLAEAASPSLVFEITCRFALPR